MEPVDVLVHCDAHTQNPTPASSVSPAELPPHPVAAGPRYVDDLLLLRFRRRASAKERQDALTSAQVTFVRTIAHLGVTVVRTAPEHRDAALDDLQSSPAIASVELDAVMQALDTVPNDTDWSAQWGLRRAGFPAAWDRGRGAGIVVAVLDTGVDGVVPDLQDVVRPGFNAVSPQSAPTDDNGHGTAVAGIIAARTDNHEGIAGICWACSILSVKVLGADGTGDTSLLAAGIVHAADAGARVISMSLGGPGDSETLDAAVAYAEAKGAILVAAAGNNGTSAPFYPAALPGVVGVAATDQADHLYSWSDFGSWVQVAAPGCNPAPSSAGGYVVFCGTSSAAPVVAGLVALQLSQQPAASSQAIINALESTAVPIGDGVVHGRVDAASAVGALASLASSAPAGSGSTAAAPAKVTLRGRLSLRVPRRTFSRAVAQPMLVGATLTFSGARTLTLSVRSDAGQIIGHVQGRSPLRLSQQLAAGTYAFTVASRKTKASFALTLVSRPAQ